MDVELCSGFTSSHWKLLSQRLSDQDEEAWQQAIGVFEKRMRERFFNCIDALASADTKPDKNPTGKGGAECIPGFAIIALCCLVIETLQSFREEAPTTEMPKGPCPFPTGKCIKPPPGTNKLYSRFLELPEFGNAFDGIGQKFAQGVRNGIFHEAETRKWVIWREEPATMVAVEGDGFALNRTLFYNALKRAFERYLTELRAPSNADFRRRFQKKMDDLCRVA